LLRRADETADDDPAPPRRPPRGRRVPDDDDRPRRRRRRDDREDESDDGPRRRRARQGGVPVWVWLAVGGGALLLLGMCAVGGLIVWAVSGGGSGGGSLPAFLGGNPVTADNYYKINYGMTEAQVKNILGQPTSAQNTTVLFRGDRILTWQNGNDQIILFFDNGKVVDGECSFTDAAGVTMTISGLDYHGGGPSKK
jgi:hypothetical protein